MTRPGATWAATAFASSRVNGEGAGASDGAVSVVAELAEFAEFAVVATAWERGTRGTSALEADKRLGAPSPTPVPTETARASPRTRRWDADGRSMGHSFPVRLLGSG
jgi:hypothetical protein